MNNKLEQMAIQDRLRERLPALHPVFNDVSVAVTQRILPGGYSRFRFDIFYSKDAMAQIERTVPLNGTIDYYEVENAILSTAVLKRTKKDIATISPLFNQLLILL